MLAILDVTYKVELAVGIQRLEPIPRGGCAQLQFLSRLHMRV